MGALKPNSDFWEGYNGAAAGLQGTSKPKSRSVPCDAPSTDILGRKRTPILDGHDLFVNPPSKMGEKGLPNVALAPASVPFQVVQYCFFGGLQGQPTGNPAEIQGTPSVVWSI